MEFLNVAYLFAIDSLYFRHLWMDGWSLINLLGYISIPNIARQRSSLSSFLKNVCAWVYFWQFSVCLQIPLKPRTITMCILLKIPVLWMMVYYIMAHVLKSSSAIPCCEKIAQAMHHIILSTTHHKKYRMHCCFCSPIWIIYSGTMLVHFLLYHLSIVY